MGNTLVHLRTVRKKASLFALICASTLPATAQVFVVGEKTATADVKTDFHATSLDLPQEHLNERGRRDLVRNLDAEQGFAHRALPMGGQGLVLQANGPLTPGPEEYKQVLYSKGQAAAPGDRVAITALEIKNNQIVIDVNGGPYLKHRFLRHISINDSNIVPVGAEDKATGARITLVFEGYIPQLSAAEVKSLLAPVIDFGVKTTEKAYADTLPEPLKEAVDAHEVLVGMSHRMVLAALGAPESKLREQSDDPKAGRYEEWIYGHTPQTVRFVRFKGDRVSLVKIAALGKPIEIHDQNEVGDYAPGPVTRTVLFGDAQRTEGEEAAPPPPSLRQPGDPVPADAHGRVLYPVANDDKKSGTNAGGASSDATPIPAPPTEQSPSGSAPIGRRSTGGIDSGAAGRPN